MIKKAVHFIQNALNKKNGRQEIIADFHTTIMRVDDNFISSSAMILDENLRGNIYSLKEVIVADTAEISGNVTSRTATISGKVYGDITSLDYADIKSTAVISGHIRASAISIEAGAIINGSVRIEGNIDDRDLLEKVENRLPAATPKEPSFLTFLPEDPVGAEMGPKLEMRRPEVNRRPVASVALKNRPAEAVEVVEPEEQPVARNGWY